MESVSGSDTTYEISVSESRLTVYAKDCEPLPKNCQPPKLPVWEVVFKVLCIIAVSRTSLGYWRNMEGTEWKEHTKAMINRFHYSNLTPPAVLVMYESGTTQGHVTMESCVVGMAFSLPGSRCLLFVSLKNWKIVRIRWTRLGYKGNPKPNPDVKGQQPYLPELSPRMHQPPLCLDLRHPRRGSVSAPLHHSSPTSVMLRC
ncbi:hypothetical protein AZE42_11963 [Rhizopogon vesiculosus]|uniref:Uncharacterized protein n=1 Tax=Rhizopogon vesiculosus TaxID=180088 RepID=A0A1J8R2D3_9AGAM|nr:hypothetical protein AZE42_11963 [Rhizopogon vesiculosus]